jgi:alpha,alpha-trehalase
MCDPSDIGRVPLTIDIHAPASSRGPMLQPCPSPEADHVTPADRYQELFVRVQRERVFADSKTFPDCSPRMQPVQILEAYRRDCSRPDFDLAAFVEQHFTVQQVVAKAYVSPAGQTLAQHIDALWDVLTRHPAEHPPQGSLLPLPFDYIVPGGRFVELYYWDSYFTMLGLAGSARPHLLLAMLRNFAFLIERYGFVPNGTRTYYLSRSQPPVFALMVELCESHAVCNAADFLPHLLREHAFWMSGADGLAAGEAHERVVRLKDGAVLNRYWDSRDSPREESYREDLATTAQGSRPAGEVCRDLRAACESGWDFSSRWLDGPHLHSIRTTCLLPVDLNAFLHRLESLIARLSRGAGDEATAGRFEAMADSRRRAIDALCWDQQLGAYFDYDWVRGRRSPHLTAATVTPLFAGIASKAQAAAVAQTSRNRLLAPGGFATTLEASGEQWDRPNGWAPIQWLAVNAFERTGHASLAAAIRSRWLRTVGEIYRHEHKVVEKYALRETARQRTSGGGGGEYPLQDGFGWTNGVTRNWLKEKPAHDVTAGGAAPPPDSEDTESDKPMAASAQEQR